TGDAAEALADALVAFALGPALALPPAERVGARSDDAEVATGGGGRCLEPEARELAARVCGRRAHGRADLDLRLVDLADDVARPVHGANRRRATPERARLGIDELVLLLHADRKRRGRTSGARDRVLRKRLSGREPPEASARP